MEALWWSLLVTVVAAALWRWMRRTSAVVGDFKGKVVWITGASSGLGEALALELQAAGARLILSARREDQLERVRQACLALAPEGEEPSVLPLDVAELASLEDKVKEATAIHGRIDVLINNAGVSVRAPAMETKLEVDQRVMNINYFGTIALTKALVPAMAKEKTGGHIVVISSVQGKLGIPFRSAYAASKHALHGFFDSARFELEKQGIAVTLVCPGYIKTDLSLNALTGSGTSYGKMDETTAKGYEPAYVAQRVMQAVSEKRDEIMVAKPDAAVGVFLKVLCPSLLKTILRKRAVTH